VSIGFVVVRQVSVNCASNRSGVKQAIKGHLVRLTIKARDLLWRAP
jgi:tRNA threonylcarbamoyladenosine modification (KEOPS) complex  Pcc1 subunit